MIQILKFIFIEDSYSIIKLYLKNEKVQFFCKLFVSCSIIYDGKNKIRYSCSLSEK